MRVIVAAAIVLTLSPALAPPAQAEVRVKMHDGLVSLTANNATVRQILAEWAVVGQTKIVNAEGIAGGPISLQLTEVPEQLALDIILRTAGGYLAAPRPTAIVNASRFDRILVMPESMPAGATSRAAPAAPTFPAPRQPMSDPDDDQPPLNAPPPAPPLSQRVPPGFNTFPQPVTPEQVNGAPPPVQSTPAAPTPAIGVAVPGMIVQPPVPPPPGFPGAPPQPRQP